MAFETDQHVVIPSHNDTGVVITVNTKDASSSYNVRLDFAKEIKELEELSLKKMPWKYRRYKNGFLIIAKSFKSFRRKRRYRVQFHVVHDDGSIGRRVIVIDLANGKPVRSIW